MGGSTGLALPSTPGIGRPQRRGPRFDLAPAPGGYLWWYVDGISDDGVHGITLIAMLGSVFSPYYAWAGRRDPLDHVALNVAVYGGAGKRWAVTERRRGALHQAADALRIGPSNLAWDGRTLTVDIDERGAPIPLPIQGRVHLTPTAVTDHRVVLDPDGRHRWWPIAPCARIEVDLIKPRRRWEGVGYLDTNDGDASLEADFAGWHWSRLHLGSDCAIYYDATYRDGGGEVLALRCRPDGSVEPTTAPPRVPLPTTGWRIGRATRASETGRAQVRATFEDTPFYARSLLDTEVDGTPALGMHESLDLDRFASRWVKLLLPFRMPRTRR